MLPTTPAHCEFARNSQILISVQSSAPGTLTGQNYVRGTINPGEVNRLSNRVETPLARTIVLNRMAFLRHELSTANLTADP